MWLAPAFISALLIGIYDVSKKQSLRDNAVMPVLFLNTLFSSLIFLPLIVLSYVKPGSLSGTMFHVPPVDAGVHKYVVIKSCIVLSSWICGYFGIKHIPITIVGPINTTRPVIVLFGAVIIFGERLNLYQWIGVSIAVVSFYLLSRSGKSEGIDFRSNRWILLTVAANVLAAVSGLYDKYLLTPSALGGLGIDRMVVQSWFNIYQFFMMGAVFLLLWYPKRKFTTPFHWEWSILCISLFLAAADFSYFYSLSLPGSMVSIVSMIRRGSVVVSFMFGAVVFREKNALGKSIDLLLMLAGMVFLYFGSK